MHRLFLGRPAALIACSALTFSSSWQALGAVGRTIDTLVLAQVPQSDYTDTPGTVDPGPNPQVQPLYQGGLWDDQTLASYNESLRIEAGLDPTVDPPVDSYSPGDTGDTGDNQALIGRPDPLPRSQPILTPDRGGSGAGVGGTSSGTTGSSTTGGTTGNPSTTGGGTTGSSTTGGSTTGSSTTGSGTTGSTTSTGSTTGGSTTGSSTNGGTAGNPSTTGGTTTGGSSTTGSSTTGGTTGGGTTPSGPVSNPPTPGSNPSGPTAGPGNPWEGDGPGGGSSAAPGTVNTQTGNRMATMPIFGWKTKGGMPFGLTLYHNSQDGADLGWGAGWRSTFDMRALYTGNTVSTSSGSRDYLTVTYPTGKRVTFTRQQTGAQPTWGPRYYPPAGYYDIVYSVSGGLMLRTKDQHLYWFNSQGYLTAIQDRYGNRIAVTFTNGALTKATDATGRSLTFNWGSVVLQVYPGYRENAAAITSMTGPSGRTWAFNQDAGPLYNRDDSRTKYLRGVTPPTSYDAPVSMPTFGYAPCGAILSESFGGGTFSYGYDANLRLASFTDPVGNQTGYAYNGGSTVRTNPDGGQQTDFYSSGLLYSEQDEAGFTRTYTYDSSYNVTQLLDERGNLQRYAYDAFGNCTSAQDPRQYAAGKSTSTTYNSYNDPMTATDTRGAATTLARDSGNGTLLSVTDGLNNVLETNAWDTTGVLTGTSSVGATTNATYDGDGNLSTVTGPSGGTSLTYGDNRFPDKPTSWIDDRTGTMTVVYDGGGRVDKLTRGDGATMTIDHDATNRVTKVTDWLGHATQCTYDAAGRRIGKTDALNHSEAFGYDACNRVTTITDGRGKMRTYDYTKRGELRALTLADYSSEVYKYDAGGNQTQRTNGLNQTTVYAYDSADNLQSVTYPTGPGVTYAYDLDGRTASMTDATGVSTWTYDFGDHLTALVTPQGTQNYSYDGWGRRTLEDLGGGATIATNYVNERLSSVVKMPENETTRFGYDSIDEITVETLPNGATTRYGYDSLGRVNAITHRRPDASVISAESYRYDAGGNLSYKVVDGVRTDYTYDAADQLLNESPANGPAESYTYDANGNRATKTINGYVEGYTYDDGDKLLRRTGGPAGTYTYGYDACGRTTSVASFAGTTTLGYDYEDRMVSLVGPGLNTSYTYNGADARVAKTGSGGAQTYRRDGVGVTDPVLSDGVATMVPGISERAGGATRFSHLDRLGTKTRATDAGGNVAATRTYDAFGSCTGATDWGTSQAGFASAFGYQEDVESGLKLLGHRYYDPETGRFLTRDPIGSGTNWYRYADNNPLKSVDPEGLMQVAIKPGTDDYQKILSRIQELRANGEAAAADELQSMLESGRIYKETDPTKMKGIGTDSKGNKYDAAAFVPAGGNTIIIDAHVLSTYDSKQLLTLLLHEVTHVDDNQAGIPGNEQHANKRAADYARRRSQKHDREGNWIEWEGMVDWQEDYRKKMAGRDLGRLAPFIAPVIFGGSRW